MREIVLDTETTGISPAEGHRVIEIGAVELVNYLPTGASFHAYLDPERSVPKEAEAIHGLSTAFLKGKPKFKDILTEFRTFIGEDQLIIHNAPFDVGFLNAELEQVGAPLIAFSRVTDTLLLARKRHPTASNSLDALCRRYGIDNAKRTKHGALLDSELLAEVYLELIGGRQVDLQLQSESKKQPTTYIVQNQPAAGQSQRANPLPQRLTAEDQKAHQNLIALLGPTALWDSDTHGSSQ
jgi:DNA polymerase III subunit epsilon